jgi:1-deoxy-D-xylulose-5-phosphate reductoisomerase
VKRILVLGSTGSVGRQALQVIANSTDMNVAGLACKSDADAILEQAMSMGVRYMAIEDAAAAASVSPALYPETRILSGEGAAARLVREVEADLVLNAVVGFAGLASTVAALECGVTLALANKESLVSGGRLVMGLAEERRVPILPVDSEHSALHQLLVDVRPEEVSALVLTASGGPFRGRKPADLRRVAPAEALIHPTWNMGPKITIDSATLMNKGLEIIEAHHLFGVAYEAIEVVIHPGSLVHSLVRLCDGALLAHLGVPDMRVPIAYALNHPRRLPTGVPPLDLAAGVSLSFEAPDEELYPALPLVRAAGRAGDAATCALNAANEIAVYSFLEGTIGFVDIVEVVEEVLAALDLQQPSDFAAVSDIDRRARHKAAELCGLRNSGSGRGRGPA